MTDFADQDSGQVVTSPKVRSPVKKQTNWFIEIERYLAGAISIGVLLLAWEALSRVLLPWLNPRAAILMPPPSLVVLAGWELIRSGVLLEHTVASTQRVLLAWGAVCVIAIPLGIAMGWWGRFNSYFNPIIELLRPIPPLAWIPISILWFGIGLQQNIFIIMIGCFFPVLLNTIHGVRGIDPVLIRAAKKFLRERVYDPAPRGPASRSAEHIYRRPYRPRRRLDGAGGRRTCCGDIRPWVHDRGCP